MQHPLSTLPAAVALLRDVPAPLTPDEQVTDHTLRLLARGDAQRASGIISDEHHAILCATLTDILGELLALRAANRKDLPKGLRTLPGGSPDDAPAGHRAPSWKGR